VHLTGLVLISLSEKDLKQHLRGFVTGLIEGLSGKDEQNRREINLTLNKIAENIGR
jgi:hypothetical protein